MTILDNYWPNLTNIQQCIRTEAETTEDAVLLAVHEPGPLRVRAANGSAEETRTEQDLLEALLRPADDGSAVVVAITGDSGVGKSHMVRWLHAQLQRHPSRERLVIVLVPKTASLRQVVELILRPLSGEGYDKLRAELAKAIETLSPGAAAEMLAAALAIELDRRATEWRDALVSSGNTSDTQARDRIFHAQGLREILRDGAVLDHWLGPVLLRIVTQTLLGGSEAESGALRRFTPDDLNMPENWDVTQAGQAAQRYLQRLQTNEGAGCIVAADVLQDVLDPALRKVFRFSEALGQRTIEEIVDDIRQQLLEEDKELVLLIEDFAALAGIQQPLLNLMIAESDHQGQRIRAPLRTALAVTDGFLPSRQTILTRAKQEWIIPSAGLSQEVVIERLTDLAGRYLNAARWGVDALRDQFNNSSHDDLHGWVRPFQEDLDDDEDRYLRAFGKSRDGFALFPLSAQSIASLCRRQLRTGNALIFNPRAFINQVLRDVLMQRPLHEAAAFPPPRFKGAVLSASVEIALRPKGYPQEILGRLSAAIVHWAGEPTDLQESPQIDKGVFDAFGLPWPFSSSSSPRPVAPPRREPTGVSPGPETPPASGGKPGTQGLEAVLDNWATGMLPQQQAAHVRNILAAALNDRIDWNSVRMRPLPITAKAIWLPFAPTGNPTAEPALRVADEVRPVSPDARKGIVALDRWYANKKHWDYPGSEDDYAIAQHLLDGLERQALVWAMTSALRESAVSVRILHRQALMMGLSRKAEPSQPRLPELFAPSSPCLPEADTNDRSPAAMVANACVRASEARPQLQKLLVDSIGCFQGTSGNQAHAIDAERLRKAWKEAETDDDHRRIRVDATLARDAAQELGRLRLPALLTRYASASAAALPKLKDAVGSAAEEDLVGPLRLLIAKARKLALFPSDKFVGAEVDRALELLASDEAVNEIRRVTSFVEPEANRSLEVQLAGWAVLNVSLLSRLADAASLIENLLAAIEREARVAIQTSGGIEIAERLAAFLASLKDAETAV